MNFFTVATSSTFILFDLSALNDGKRMINNKTFVPRGRGNKKVKSKNILETFRALSFGERAQYEA